MVAPHLAWIGAEGGNFLKMLNLLDISSTDDQPMRLLGAF
jgi:hypothetical protein